MRTLSVRPDHADEDIESGRAILDQAIAHPSKTVMLIRRVGPEITRFVDKAAARTDPFPWREAVWITDQMIFRPGQEVGLFGTHTEACAVILDIRNQPAVWLSPSAKLFDIDDGLLQVEEGAP